MRATAEVPGRITRTVATVPGEGTGNRGAVHVPAGDHQPRAVVLPYSVYCSRRLRLCVCLFFGYAAGSSGG